MARGWESKSVDEQQSLHTATDLSSDSAEKARNVKGEAAAERRKRDLELQRERILSERTASPVRRAALQAALEEIESRLKALD